MQQELIDQTSGLLIDALANFKTRGFAAMDIIVLRKVMRPPVVIGGAFAVAVLVAVLAAASGTKTSSPELPAPPDAIATSPNVAVLAQPKPVAAQPGIPTVPRSPPAPPVTPGSVNIHYRPLHPLGTTMQPGIELVANYTGGKGSQMAQIFTGTTVTNNYDITTSIDQIKEFALANDSAKLAVISSGYIKVPTTGEYTLTVMETCEDSICEMSLFLNDTTVPLMNGESGYAYFKRKTIPYTAAANLHAGYHKIKVTQTIHRRTPASSSSARVLLKGPGDSGLLDALVYIQPKS